MVSVAVSRLFLRLRESESEMFIAEYHDSIYSSDILLAEQTEMQVRRRLTG